MDKSNKNIMKKLIILLLPAILFMACSTDDPDVIQLREDWRIQSSVKTDANAETISSPGMYANGWYKIDIPKTVLAAMAEHNVYPDPYFGSNLKSIPGYREGRWLSMPGDSPFYPTWWYRKSFMVPEEFKGKTMVLHLDGINYKANVWLNGRKIADSSDVIGMFRRFEFDVDNFINPGEENVLALEISAPGKVPDIKYRTKQIEATTGWDDHNPQPPDLNMGIWRDVYISASNGVVLKNPYVVTDLDLPDLDKAFLTLSVEAVNKTDGPVEGKIRGTTGNINISKSFSLGAGETNTIKFTPEEFTELIVQNPELWWPHPVGEQHLQLLKLDAVIDGRISDSKDVRFGIREVSTYINEEGWRGYKVNGKNILIRGGAWMTSDMMLNLSHRRYDALIRYAREANLNVLRSEGFSIRETDEFYNLCDEYGILVVQQIFGRNLPDEPLAVDLIEDMILRIRNHPSLIHFLGHDETFPTENLDKSYRELIEKYTPQRTYQPHSGAFDIEDRFETGGTRTGTLELWTYATPSHYYTHKQDGAWGFAQSGGIGGIFAPYESTRRMMPEEDLWPIHNETFSFHTVLQGLEYFNHTLKSLNERYGKPAGIQELLMKGQAMNYESARGMYEAYARNKYDALGITTWKYDAAWPAVLTWQYVDWYLNVGGAYYGAKKACEPLHVQYAYDDQSVYVVNSYYEDFDNLQVTARVYNFDLNEVYSDSTVVSVAADGIAEAFKIDFPDKMSKTYFLRLALHNAAGERVSGNFYWLSTSPDIQGSKEEIKIESDWDILKADPESYADFKDLNDLPKVKIDADYEVEQDGSERTVKVTLKNAGTHLAFQVHLALIRGEGGDEIFPVYWDENYINLLPGESRNISARYLNYDPGSPEINLKIDGWNVEN
jgi:exo-1,4-beta-D-glucosaminidase